MALKKFPCLAHGKEHTNEWGWKYRGWETEQGIKYGWVCADEGQIKLPEFTTDAIRKGREEFASDMVQSHRGGEFSKEYAELYPNRTKAMIKDGVVTKDQVANSKYVWKNDIKHWERNKKHDAKALAKEL